MNKESTLREVRNIFSTWMEKNNQRKTKERFAILEEIYRGEGHYNADRIFNLLKAKKYKVSLATVYNTLDLLVECGLVKRHQFEKSNSEYEASYGSRQHDHMICESCKSVIEFCDPRIQEINSVMGNMLEFEVRDHSLLIFGVCKSCRKKLAVGN